MTSDNDDDKPAFDPVTVFGDDIDDAIERQIQDLNGGTRKWEIFKTKLPNDAGYKVTIYFTDERHTNVSFLWGNLSRCSDKYTCTRVFVKGVTISDSLADSKTKSRVEFYYGGCPAPEKKVIDTTPSNNIVLEYDESFPQNMSASPEAGGFELLASLMEKNLGTITSADDDGNKCKRKYRVLPPETLTSMTDGAYLIKVSNLTNEFYYETVKDMLATTFGKLAKHRLASDFALLVLDADIYLFVKALRVVSATKADQQKKTERGRGHGLRKPVVKSDNSFGL